MYMKTTQTVKVEEKIYDRYKENGYEDRHEYLESLADSYGVESIIVHSLADILGESEDFDGLVSAMEDCWMLF